MQARTSLFRFFRLSDESQLPFFPLGFFGVFLLLGTILYGLTYFAKAGIEDNILKSVSNLLITNGFDSLNVEVDGQNVKLYGTTSKTEGSKAVTLAKQATGYTWLGSLTAPIVVTSDFKQEVISKSEASSPVVDKLVAQWGRVFAQAKGNTTTLEGLVSSHERAEQIEASANSSNLSAHISTVSNRLTVSSEPLKKGTQELEDRLIASLPFCISGSISSIGGVFSMKCQVRRADSAIAESIAREPFQHAELGEIELDTTEDCNTILKNTLSQRKINFSISSALLKDSSSGLLDEIAQLLMTCPRNILVEGHTDDTGDKDLNVSLSQKRAKSVVDALVSRGLALDRISSKGFGPTLPLEVGTSREIRAKNRRIEIRLVDTGAN